MKVEVAVDATKNPVGVTTDAADAAEIELGCPALATTPVVADRAYDSDPFRVHLALGSLWTPCKMANLTRPMLADGRRFRRYRHWGLEQSIAWLHSYRWAVTWFEQKIHQFDRFVSLTHGRQANLTPST